MLDQTDMTFLEWMGERVLPPRDRLELRKMEVGVGWARWVESVGFL